MRDITLLLETPKHRDRPDFLMNADELGKVVTCFGCGKIIGAGVSADEAEADVHENGTGVYMKGNWFCSADAPTNGHPPVPSGLQKHKSPARKR